MKTFRSLSDATAKIGEHVRITNDTIDAIYKRLDQRSAYAKQRAEYGKSPMWEQRRAIVAPEGLTGAPRPEIDELAAELG